MTLHKGEHCLVKWLLTLPGHNFVNNGSILTILVPIKSPGSWLSIGTKMVKLGPLITKLWPFKVNHHFTNQYLPLCTVFFTYVKTACLHINSRRFFVHKETRTILSIM